MGPWPVTVSGVEALLQPASKPARSRLACFCGGSSFHCVAHVSPDGRPPRSTMFMTAAAPAVADWAQSATTGWDAADGDGGADAGADAAGLVAPGVVVEPAEEHPVTSADAPTSATSLANCVIFCMTADSIRA